MKNLRHIFLAVLLLLIAAGAILAVALVPTPRPDIHND